MRRLRQFFGSMAGRLFVILLLGMGGSAIVVAALANASRQQEFERQQLVRAADRLQGFVQLLDSNPEIRERLLAASTGVRRAPEQVRVVRQDEALMALLAQRTGPLATARVEVASFGTCLAELRDLLPDNDRPRPPRMHPRGGRSGDPGPPRCRVISVDLSDGTQMRLTMESTPVLRDRLTASDPAYIVLLVLALAGLAYGVARMASAPLRGLAAAATGLGRDLDRSPMAETGPSEVRHAAQAFNAMQQQLKHHLAQRTQMLAAITHDLQTPLTRLRLRLENVDDEGLRTRLIADLAAMQALIREGLDLARSEHGSEKPVPLELDSLLESLVEDAVEAGADVTFEGGCGQVLALRPMAMRRLFSNLIDNALKYGGSARVQARFEQGRVSVHVRDAGPGIPESAMDSVFDPFVRLEDSRSRDTGGAGLGLAIAKALADRDGAQLSLHNHPEGGLEAVVRWA